MKYRVAVSNVVNDERVDFTVSAKSVFDAIDKVAKELTNPEKTELLFAQPVDCDEEDPV